MTFVMGCIFAIASLLSQGATSSLQSGYATWYDTPGLTAAAGPELRHGDWRGSRVEVCRTTQASTGRFAAVLWRPGASADVRVGGRPSAPAGAPLPCVTVTLTDWCACGDRNGRPTLLDLSASAFRRLAPLSRGVIEVEVTFAKEIPLPPTDTE